MRLSEILGRRRITTPCTITVLHTDETLEAHVELDGKLLPTVGDKITVHGAPVRTPYGETMQIRRNATLVRANTLDKLWVLLKSRFLFTELYEVSFSTGKLR
ncbi:MAG: hypothetical protein AAF850_01080 [Pseudomonadota bacterium]